MATKLLVTGGAGFIGSNFCEHLLEYGYSVRYLDKFAIGKWQTIIPLINRFPESFEMLVGDIRKMDDCRKAVEGIEYVFHEAALGSVQRSSTTLLRPTMSISVAFST